MKVLVAGGAGFIGSHLIDSLLDEGHTVVCVDNFFIGAENNILHLKTNRDFIFYNIDIDNLEEIKKIFKKEKIDFVFHLAANSDIKASAENPETELRNTLLTTFNLLECMRLYGVKKIFFASTSAVYGEKNGILLSEYIVPLEPISYYGAAKLSSEALISAFSSMNDFSTLIFRFPNVIGGRLTHGVVYDFINKLKENRHELYILGDGTQNKPYMHVSDLVKGIASLKENLGKGISLYNIGVNSKTTVNRIADIVCEGMKLENVKYIYSGGKIGWKGDVATFDYDLTKINNAGWKASMSSDEAVVATVKEMMLC